MIPVKIVSRSNASIPVYQSDGSAGADICACVDENIVINPGSVALIPTGLCMEIPLGYEAQIRPRSGLALKNGISLLNTPGTIDSDYRGEIKIIMINLGKEPFTVTHGMRIAQMVFSRYYKGEFTVESELAETVRGAGGFGHTGT